MFRRNKISKNLPAPLMRLQPDESEKSPLDFERSFNPDRSCKRMKLTDPQKKVKGVPNCLCSLPRDLDRSCIPFAGRSRGAITCRGSERKNMEADVPLATKTPKETHGGFSCTR
jgi:hypothetical protein